MFEKIRNLFSTSGHEAELQKHLEEIRAQLPTPVLWLFGRTQSGKSTIVRFLTGADAAEIGKGFQPCTQFSQRYSFPSTEAPLLDFLDTRGLDEPNYDPSEDLNTFDAQTHVLIVTVKLADHAQENILRHLQTLRSARPTRPVLLVLTCLHEAYPQTQHPQPYPWTFDDEALKQAVPEEAWRHFEEHRRRFAGLVDRIVAVDLTRPEEGYEDPNYGGDALKSALLELLPATYRQSLVSLDEATGELQDLYERLSLPHILGYSTLAATAGAFPLPLLDLVLLPGIQTRMLQQLATIYGQPLDRTRFLEIAGTLGIGMMVRQAGRSLSKIIPFVGSAASAALAGASTYALGKAFCYYYGAVLKGHVPRAEDLKRYYQEQLSQAEKHWKRAPEPEKSPSPQGEKEKKD